MSIKYQVYAWDLSVRSAHFDTSHAYFNGTSLFLQVQGQEHKACVIELERPVHPFCASWRVATSLTRAGAQAHEFGRYSALDYDDLIDHPIEIGDFSLSHFEAAGKRHEMVIQGRHNADLERLKSDLQRVCEQHVSLFGELPLDNYLFLVTAVGDGYGGLEHRTSTSLLCSRDDLPVRAEKAVTEGYRRFLGLCSHEYFHLWNVKRIRPLAFVRQGLAWEVHTRLLWVFEGITSYYDDLALARSGCIDTNAYLDILAQTITRVMRGSGRLKQSVAESSFDAWTKFYKQDENAPNAIVSYYSKGSLVALCLDLILRSRTDGAWSLDDVMRALWKRYGKPGIGVPESGVEQLIQELSGLDLGAFFDQAIRGTEDLPLQELLSKVGVELRLRPAKDAKDNGGSVDEFTPMEERYTLGVELAEEGTEVVITRVFDGGAAQQAGLAAGDALLALNGLKIGPGRLQKMLDRLPANTPGEVHVFRRDELMRFDVTPIAASADTCELRFVQQPDETAIARRRSWLGPGVKTG
jgi:predicted metalloprotease with PDZ domain